MVATFQAKTAIRATGLAMLSMLCLLAVILVVESYNSDRAKASIAAHRAAHVVATQYDWMFEASAHALQRIEDSVVTKSSGKSPSEIRTLGNAVRDLPAGFSYSVFDAAGNLTHSSRPGPSSANIATEPYFRAARDGTELALAPALASGDAPVNAFLMVRRLNASGPFTGIATISIPATTLTTLAETLGLGDPSTIALVRADGILLGRTPVVKPLSLAGWQLFTELETASDGTFEAVSPADGVERIIGYWHLPNWPVIALAGLDHTSALRPFWRNLLTSAILALPILLGMGWLVLDLLHLLRVDEQRQIGRAHV